MHLLQDKQSVEAEIAEREATIAAGGIKKGVINFNQNKIDSLKNEIKQLEEDQRNLPKWLQSARDFTIRKRLWW